ncbi:hypothetical protein ACHAW6_013488 [Cyclotella cf. meneghiniana]
MDQPEYMKLKLNLIPIEIVQEHNLHQLKHNGWIYICIDLRIYGLPQARILANKLLTKQLDEAGYYQCQFIPGLWQHIWRPLLFCHVIDDYGIKTVGLTHVKHLHMELKKHYDVSMNYKNRTVDLSLPVYIQKTLLKFGHNKPKKPQHSPYQVAPIEYGSKQQQHPQADDTPPILADQIKFIQQVIGTLLFLAIQSTQHLQPPSVPLRPDKTMARKQS